VQTTASRSDERALEQWTPTVYVPGAVLTKEQRNAIADRLEAFLRVRKRIAEERRRQESEYRARNSERARERYRMIVRNKNQENRPQAATLNCG